MSVKENQILNDPIVYLMLEIEKRELPARLLLAKYLLNNFSRVVIFQHSQLDYISMFSKPGIIVFKSLPKTFNHSLILLKKRGFVIILSHEEGLHFNSFSTSDISISNIHLDKIDHYLAWHEFDKQFAINNGIPKNKISVVGNIRFQIANQNRFRFPPPQECIKVLILDNFLNSVNRIREKRKGNTEQEILINDLENLNKKNLNNKTMYQDLYSGLKRLKIDFRVREYSYGAENSDLVDLDVPLDRSLSILDSIKDRNIVIHYGSTGGLEAIMSGRLSIILSHPENYIDPRIRAVSMQFNDSNQLLDYLLHFSIGTVSELQSVQEELLISKYGIDFRKIDSAKLIVDVVDGLRNKVEPRKYSVYFHLMTSAFLVIGNGIRHMLGRLLRRQKQYLKKAYPFSYECVIGELKMLNIDIENWLLTISRKGKMIEITAQQ